MQGWAFLGHPWGKKIPRNSKKAYLGKFRRRKRKRKQHNYSIITEIKQAFIFKLHLICSINTWAYICIFLLLYVHTYSTHTHIHTCHIYLHEYNFVREDNSKPYFSSLKINMKMYRRSSIKKFICLSKMKTYQLYSFSTT